MRAGEIADRLANQAESVASYLLPNGKRDGTNWVAGSIFGDSGKSLKVVLSGSKTGRWCDHADDCHHGDLLDLWAETMGVPLGNAIGQAKEYLGLVDPVRAAPVNAKETVRPSIAKGVIKLAHDGDVASHLWDKRRISFEVASKYRMAEMHDHEHGAVMIFNSFADGELKLMKYRVLNGKKMWTSKGSAKVLFGWQALPDKARSIVLTEGEVDAMSLATVGIPALSIPFGAGKQSQNEWIENDFDRLERFDEIIIWMDDDEAGRSTAVEIATRLGIERCRLAFASDDFNDPNEMLQHDCKQVHFQRCIDEAKAIEPDHLRSAGEFCQEVIAEFYPAEGIEPGIRLGWNKTEWLVFRPAELIVVSGINGHGKSQFAGQLMLYAMNEGHRCVIASMELPARRLLHRLTRQASALESPTPEFIEAIHEWYEDRLWIYDRTGRVDIEQMLEAFTYSRRRYGCDVFLIDSLMMCGIRSDDYAGQKEFVEKLVAWKLENNATVFLVTHSRKQQNEAAKPDKMDVRGAGEITDLADTVLTCWRNKSEKKKDDDIDGLIECSKQRNSGDEGKIPVWFDKDTTQFLPYPTARSFQFVGWSRLEKGQVK